MLQPEQAKSRFRNILLWMVATILWPFLSLVVIAILGIAGVKTIGVAMAVAGVVWLAAFVALIVTLWRTAPEINTTPWASLWALVPWVGYFLVGMLFLEPLKYAYDGKPADKRLPLTWSLIKDSIKFAASDVKAASKTTIWYLYLALASGVSAALTLLWEPYAILHLLLVIALAVFTAWVSIKLMLEVAARESGNSPKGDEGEKSKNGILSYFVTTLLVMLITVGPMFAAILVSLVLVALAGVGLAALGGSNSTDAVSILAQTAIPLVFGVVVFFFLFIGSVVWAIYKGNQYAFIMPVLLLEGRFLEAGKSPDKGYYRVSTDAMNESVRITKGRWWGVYWKTQMFGLIVGISIGIALQLVLVLLMMALGYAINSQTALGMSVNIITSAFQGALQMLLMPLVFVFQIKMYRAFKQSA